MLQTVYSDILNRFRVDHKCDACRQTGVEGAQKMYFLGGEDN